MSRLGKGSIANRIVIGVSDMNTITYDYVMNPSERARQQWELKHASLGELISRRRHSREKKRGRSWIGSGQSRMKRPNFFIEFWKITKKRDRPPQPYGRFLMKTTKETSTQLMARSQIMISDAFSLFRISYAEIRQCADLVLSAYHSRNFHRYDGRRRHLPLSHPVD